MDQYKRTLEFGANAFIKARSLKISLHPWADAGGGGGWAGGPDSP